MNLTDLYTTLVEPAFDYAEPYVAPYLEFFKPTWDFFEPYIYFMWEFMEPFFSFLYTLFLRFFAYFGLDLIQIILDFVTEIDLDLLSWCIWLFIPIIIMFTIPMIVFLLLYSTAIWLQIYKARHQLYSAYNHSAWHGARMAVAIFWLVQGRIWHGYEVHGLENIPLEGPAIICYYHGAIPIDFYFLMSSMLIYRRRQMVIVVDKFMQHIPGFQLVLKVFSMIPGTIPECTKHLKLGRILGVSPGGVREAFFSDEYYQLQWGSRIGFAKCAVEAKVPIIPVFTQNCREAYRSLRFGRKCLKFIYEKTRLPVVPIYGGFPAKMRAFVGKPIPYEEGLTPEELSRKARDALEDLIKTHQKTPGNILRAIMERFPGGEDNNYSSQTRVPSECNGNDQEKPSQSAEINESTETFEH